MKITSIKQQVKKTDRVSIFVDGKYEFSLNLDELVKYKIKNGDELGTSELKKYKKISEDGKLRARALEWLLNRPHSTKEFNDYLYRKKADPDFGKELVLEFTGKGYLDDLKFSSWFIDLQSRKNKSRRAIRAELMRKGISGDLLNEVLEAEEIDEAQSIRDIIAKKKSISRYRNDPKKLAEYLARQGFSWELIKENIKLI